MILDKEQIISDKLNQHVFSKRINSDNAFLVVLSDIHQGANDRNYLQSIVSFILSIPNCYVIIGGDSTDTITRTSKGVPKDEWCTGDEQFYTLVDDLKPLVENDRIIAIGESGNHGDRLYDSSYISKSPMFYRLHEYIF